MGAGSVATTQGLIQLFIRYPVLGGLFGWVLAGMFGMLGFLHWQNVQNGTDHPSPISLSTSSHLITDERQWVVVQDARWDCSSMAPFGSGTNPRAEAMFTDKTGSVLVVALLSRQVPCAELMASPPTGEMYRMSERRYAHLLDEGRLAPYPEAITYLEMCGYCDPITSELTIGVSLFFVVLGLAMYPLCRYLNARMLSQDSLR